MRLKNKAKKNSEKNPAIQLPETCCYRLVVFACKVDAKIVVF
jgi:hypothetical protein